MATGAPSGNALGGAALRDSFPLLRGNPHLACLDSAATSQMPDSVLQAVRDFETGCRANIHRGIYPLAEAVTDAYEGARETVAAFLGTTADSIVFTSVATAALNLAVQGWGLRNLKAGTPNIAGAAGFAAACDFLGGIDRAHAAASSTELCDQVLDVLASNPRIRVLGRTAPGSHRSIVSFAHGDIHPHDLADSLGRRGVAVRAGHHCAMPLHRALGAPASVRVSFGAYSAEQDVERFARALHQAERELL